MKLKNFILILSSVLFSSFLIAKPNDCTGVNIFLHQREIKKEQCPSFLKKANACSAEDQVTVPVNQAKLQNALSTCQGSSQTGAGGSTVMRPSTGDAALNACSQLRRDSNLPQSPIQRMSCGDFQDKVDLCAQHVGGDELASIRKIAAFQEKEKSCNGSAASGPEAIGRVAPAGGPGTSDTDEDEDDH